MLDEQEYAEACSLYREFTMGVKKFRQQWNVPLASVDIDERFRPVREWYEQLTGVSCRENAIMHHRLSHLGNPCRVCGKPLRSPRAKLCVSCGTATSPQIARLPSRIDQDGSAVRDEAPDLLDLIIRNSDAALGPVAQAVSGTDPALPIGKAVDHDVAARLHT